MAMQDEVIAHLRTLRSDCSKALAWCSALLWGEKAFLLSDHTSDLLWLIDALVTNGQYRQAEEWLLHPVYAHRCRSTATGRHLACVVAMRLGRAEDALEMLNMEGLEDAAGAEAGAGADRALAAGGGGRPLDRRALVLYMQGAAAIQLANLGVAETHPGIKRLQAQVGRLAPPECPGEERRMPAAAAEAAQAAARLGPVGRLASQLWAQSLRVDARCWEAWTGLRDHGLLTSDEEQRLIDSLDWAQHTGEAPAAQAPAAQFFRLYCLATQTTALTENAVAATAQLLRAHPRLAADPGLRTIQAARLLALGRPAASLALTTRILDARRLPDPQPTAMHVTALATLRCVRALFRIAHELAEEFGISPVRRPEAAGAGAGAAAGAGRVRAGARGLLLPETPSRVAAGGGGGSLPGMRRPGAAAAGAARAVARSAASAATAAWRGLWGLPTWTHPGAPVLATYASALGPVQAPAVVHAEAGSVSTANTFTTANAQAVGGPTQYEFPGASLAWYAIGCYHLVCAMDAQGVDAERALAEARRWLAKATMAAPRSIVAWVAFAQTFAVAGEWEAAARALHTAAGLCGCDD
ncbi:anaphase-promoting complex subunit Cut9, partial [Kickxella alabastrina]